MAYDIYVGRRILPSAQAFDAVAAVELLIEYTRAGKQCRVVLTHTTADHCHCGKRWARYGSDHCEFCGCEQYEATCDADFIRGKRGMA